MDAHALNVILHVVSGSAALLVGLVPLLSRKGGPRHLWWGRLFIAVGVVNIATAIVGATLFDAPPPLVAATMAATYQFVAGRRSLAIRHSGPGVVDALLALAALVIGAWLLLNLGRGTQSWTPMIGYSTIGFAMTVALYDLSRHAWSSLWRRKAWLLDHGLKMTGAYFAMMSAGFGNVFRDWQPVSQFGPSLAGLLVALVLLVRFWGRAGAERAADI